MSNKIEDEKTYLFDNPRNVSRLLLGFYIISAGLFIADFFVHRHTVHPWEGFPGFYAGLFIADFFVHRHTVHPWEALGNQMTHSETVKEFVRAVNFAA
jgi:hypothetical protein